jgi:hypothetical protein
MKGAVGARTNDANKINITIKIYSKEYSKSTTWSFDALN